jgi:hypothetical protein
VLAGAIAYLAARPHPGATGAATGAATSAATSAKGQHAGGNAGRTTHHHSARPPAPTTIPPTTIPPTTTTTTNPGTLPQTPTLPPASSPQLRSEEAALWRGVVTGTVTTAMASFFPEAAYVQLKDLANPSADWQTRLVGEFRADLQAAHALLGTGAASATLVAVTVPEQYAHWVVPGTCYNAIGYWEVPNARLVYTVGGAVRSFGIASMISWRGQWYVVHLGAVTRPTTTFRTTTHFQGKVDDPATGPGVSAYSSTC